MITITIMQTTTKDVGATRSFLKSETPTAQRSQYNEPVVAKEYEVRDVVEQKETETLLLKQVIVTDADFDLESVIKAVNQIK